MNLKNKILLMAYLKIRWVFVIALLFANTSASGQTTNYEKQALVREMLEEKMLHVPGNTLNPAASKLTKTTGFDERISSSGVGFDEGEVSIVADPNDSNKLVLSYMQETNTGLGFPVYYSTNGGQSWTLSSFSPWNQLAIDFPGQSFEGGGDPSFAWDKNGNLYFSWIYLTINATNDTSFFTLSWASSTDGGATWTVAPGANHFIGRGAMDASSNILTYFDGITDREWLAVDNSGGPNQGNLYCSFANFPPGAAPVFEGVKVKALTDTVFGPIVTAYNGPSQFGNVEVDKSGIVHLSCADVNLQEIIHTASSNPGLSFANAAIVANGTNYFPQQQTHIVQARENAAPNLAADSAKNLHIVWSDYPGGWVNSYYSRSTDGGLTWSTRLIDSFFSQKYTEMPTIAASGNKVTISVTAYGDSTDYSPDSANYYQISSTNFGQTFGKPVKISSALTDYTQYVNDIGYFFGDYFRSVASGCNVYAAWSDGRYNLGPKIYFAKTNACSFADSTGTTSVPEITVVNGNIQLGAVYPIPAKGFVDLSINATETENITITLSDVGGKNILKQASAAHAGLQTISLELKDVKAGVYILSVMDDSGLIATRQMVVN